MSYEVTFEYDCLLLHNNLIITYAVMQLFTILQSDASISGNCQDVGLIGDILWCKIEVVDNHFVINHQRLTVLSVLIAAFFRIRAHNGVSAAI